MIALGVSNRNAAGDAIRGLYLRWAVYGLLFGLLPGLRVDNAAHIGGLAAGVGVAWLAGTPPHLDEHRRTALARGVLACLLLTGLSFVQWYLWFASVRGKINRHESSRPSYRVGRVGLLVGTTGGGLEDKVKHQTSVTRVRKAKKVKRQKMKARKWKAPKAPKVKKARRKMMR